MLHLNDSVGLHPGLGAFKSLFDQGKLAVVQGVGYPNPNRSHFRSMDIWHTANPDTFERSGWLGRYVDACQCSQSNALSAISVGDQLNGLFWTDTTLVPAISSIGAFSFVTDTKYKNDRTYQLQALQNIYNQAGSFSPFESLIRQGTLDALAGSDELQKVAAELSVAGRVPEEQRAGQSAQAGGAGDRRQRRHAAVLGQHGWLRYPREPEGPSCQSADAAGAGGGCVHAGPGVHAAPGRRAC